MEDILIALLQCLFEVLLQIVSLLPWDWVVYRREESVGNQSWGYGLLSLTAGASVAGLSLLILPHALVHHSWLRMANVLFAPLTTAWLSFLWAGIRQKKDPTVSPGHHFLFSLLFAFAFALIRFTYALRS